MMNVRAAFTLSALFFVVACGQPPKNFEDELSGTHRQIINGTSASGFSTVGAIITSQGSLCTGTLIADRVVLTAGHCVGQTNYFYDPNLSDVTPYRGQQGLCAPSGTTTQARPCWDVETSVDRAGDMALMYLNSPRPGGPVAGGYTLISPNYPSVGNTATIVGYGLLVPATPTNTAVASGAGIKRQGSVTVSQVLSTQGSNVIDGFFTAPGPNGQTAAAGDSGGPALINGKVMGVAAAGDFAGGEYEATGTYYTWIVQNLFRRLTTVAALVQYDSRQGVGTGTYPVASNPMAPVPNIYFSDAGNNKVQGSVKFQYSYASRVPPTYLSAGQIRVFVSLLSGGQPIPLVTPNGVNGVYVATMNSLQPGFFYTLQTSQVDRILVGSNLSLQVTLQWETPGTSNIPTQIVPGVATVGAAVGLKSQLPPPQPMVCIPACSPGFQCAAGACTPIFAGPPPPPQCPAVPCPAGMRCMAGTCMPNF